MENPKLNFFSKNLPKLSDGRIDYTKSKVAIVVNIVVMFKDEVLILKRSSNVSTNKNVWDCVGGYYDEDVPPENIAMKELEEELGITKKNVENLIQLETFEIVSDKNWIIYPFIAKLNKKIEIKLDWEHTEYKWIKENEARGKILKILNSYSNTIKKSNSSEKTHQCKAFPSC